MKRYEKYKEVDLPWLKEVPSHWDIKPNKSFLKLSKEVVGNKEKEYELLSLSKQGVRIKGNDDFSGKIPDSFENYQIIKQGQLIMCLFDLDQSAVFSGISNYKGKITSAYDVFDIVNMSKNFVDYYFKYIFQGRKYKIYSKSVRYTITKDDFKNIKSIIPPIQEQIQITGFLDWKISEIDKLIELETSKIEKLEEYFKKNISNKFKYCNLIKMKYLLIENLKYGLSESGFESGEYRYIRITDIDKNGYLKNENTKFISNIEKSFILNKGDVLFARSGATVGKTYFFNEDITATFAGYLIRARVNRNKIIPEYLYYYTLTENYEDWKKSISIQSTIENINSEKYSSLLIPMLNLNEQIKVVNLINNILEKKENILFSIHNKITYLEELKQTLIADVVTGKIDVRGVEIPKKFKKEE